MAGTVENIIIGILLVSIVVIGLGSFYNGLYQTELYDMNTTPKDESGLSMIQTVETTTGTLTEAIYADQPASQDLLGTSLMIATGAYNAVLMVGNSFWMLLHLIWAMYGYLGETLAIDPQILAGINAIVGVTFIFAVIRAVLGREV